MKKLKVLYAGSKYSGWLDGDDNAMSSLYFDIGYHRVKFRISGRWEDSIIQPLSGELHHLIIGAAETGFLLRE